MKPFALIAALTFAFAFVVGYDAFRTPDLCIRGVPQRAIPSNPWVVGDTIALAAGGLDILMECDNPSPARVRWESSDSSVVQVDQQGRLVALRPGHADISVKARWTEASHRVEITRRR